MPMQRKRPARSSRPQVYMSEYITTSFGYIRKSDIRNAVVLSFLAIAGFELGFRVMGWLLLWA